MSNCHRAMYISQAIVGKFNPYKVSPNMALKRS